MAEPVRARRIVKVNADNSITCDEDVMRQIFLDPQIKDKQVCVISITGTLPQENSFFMNLVLRYLKLKYKWKKRIFKNWLRSEEVISGFPWTCGRQKKGILVWPEIFVAEAPSGEEVAVVLLDTQLSCESTTTTEDSMTVFAISTLISSFQIHSMKEKLHSSDLKPFEFLARFGYMGLEEQTKTGPPFQNLCFLIRDWSYQDGYNYGTSGGDKILNQLIQSKEMWFQKATVINLFQQISCYLLPHLGKITPSDPSHKRTFNDVEPQFASHVEDFCLNVLAPEITTPKLISGEKIKVSDLLSLVRTYCKYFKQTKPPTPLDMQMATDEAQLNNALTDSITLYTKLLDQVVGKEEPIKIDVLEESHLKNKTQAIEMFNKKTILIHNATEKKLLKTLLKQNLEQRFLQYRKTNRLNQEKKEKEAGQKEFFQKQTYENELSEKFEKLQISIENFEQELDQIKENVELAFEKNEQSHEKLTQVVKECMLQHEENKENHEEMLKVHDTNIAIKIEKKMNELLLTNQRQTDKLSEDVKDCLLQNKEYQQDLNKMVLELDEKRKKDYKTDLETMKSSLLEIEEEIKENCSYMVKNLDENLLKKYESDLETMRNKLLEFNQDIKSDCKNQVKQLDEELQINCEKEIFSIKKSYEETLKEKEKLFEMKIENMKNENKNLKNALQELEETRDKLTQELQELNEPENDRCTIM